MVVEASYMTSIEEEMQTLALFQGVEAEIVRELANAAHGAQHAKGTVFLLQGQPLADFSILLEGWCGASKVNPEGQESILQIFHGGDFLTQPDCATSNALCGMNALALTPVRLLLVPPSVMRSAMERSKSFKANLLAAALRQLQELRDHIEHLTLSNAERRVGRFLLRMKFMAPGDGQEIVLPFDKAQVAAYLGIKPETFSRTLQNLRKKGIEIQRNRLNLPEREALCSYCDVHAARSCPLGHTLSCPLFKIGNGSRR